MTDSIGAVDALTVRRDTIEQAIGQLIPGSPLKHTVATLRCLRGIDTLSAVVNHHLELAEPGEAQARR